MKTKDIFIWKDEKFTIKTLGGEIQTSLLKNITKQAARITDGDRVITQFAIGDQDREALWSKCEQNWSEATPALAPMASIESATFAHEGKPLSADEFEASVAKICRDFVKKYPDFIPQGQFDYRRLSREYAQDNGKKLKTFFADVEGVFAFKHKNSSGIMDHYIEVKGDTNLNLKGLLKTQGEFLSNWNREVTLTSGKKNVCFFGTGVLLKKIREGLQPELYHSGTALFAKMAGKKIFHDDFSLSDLPHQTEQGAALFFDHEGTLTKDHPLIDRGVFLGPVYDLRTAKKFGTRSTGHGVRTSIPHGAIIPSPFNVSLHPGIKSIQENFGELGETIVVLLMAGGDNTADGEFSSPVMTSFLMKDGKVQGRLPQLTLRGNIRKYLGEDFIGVASDRHAPGMDHPLFVKLEVIVN